MPPNISNTCFLINPKKGYLNAYRSCFSVKFIQFPIFKTCYFKETTSKPIKVTVFRYPVPFRATIPILYKTNSLFTYHLKMKYPTIKAIGTSGEISGIISIGFLVPDERSSSGIIPDNFLKYAFVCAGICPLFKRPIPAL